jgi:hypothetical protein
MATQETSDSQTTAPKTSWADTTDTELPQIPDDWVQVTKHAAAQETARVDFATSSVRVFEPTNAQVYEALAACGLIKSDHAPPKEFAKGSDVQIAIYNAFYNNPRGIACKPIKNAVHSCWKTTTTCLYARIIAIIYELTEHVMTKERIEAIDFFDFNSMYSQLVNFTGNHWFGVYPIYENAALHIKEFSHQCGVICPIAHFQRELKGTETKERKMMQEYAIDHMTMYKHPTSSGPPGRANTQGTRMRRDFGAFVARDGGRRYQQVPPPASAFPEISISTSLKQLNGLAVRKRGQRGGRRVPTAEAISYDEPSAVACAPEKA